MNTTTRPAEPRRPVLKTIIVALAALSALCLAGAVLVAAMASPSSRAGVGEGGMGEVVTLLVALYAYLVVGLVLLAKTPRNPLGWTMTGVGMLTSIGAFADTYANHALAPPGRDLPGVTFAAWINSWWWFPTIALVFLFVPLLFPNGKPLSPRWRWLTWLSVTVLAALVVLAPLNPVLKGDNYAIRNPIGVAAIGDIEKSAIGSVVFITLMGCTVLALISLIVRFRRSRGVERLQMKWFVFGSASIITLVLVEELTAAAGVGHLLPDSNVVFALAVALLPVTMGIAVLKYRLYDIDRLISRTLTYGLLTAFLVAMYLAAVTALTAVTAPVTGESPVAVAAATLLAAAAFGPLRRRVQSIVDRRFNRARYDAARTVAGYRTRIRDEVDLTTLQAGLLAAVDESVQPSSTLVWLRQEAAQ